MNLAGIQYEARNSSGRVAVRSTHRQRFELGLVSIDVSDGLDMLNLPHVCTVAGKLQPVSELRAQSAHLTVMRREKIVQSKPRERSEEGVESRQRIGERESRFLYRI